MGCFVLLHLFSVARHVERFKLRLKPTPIYVRLIIILLIHQSTHLSSPLGLVQYSSQHFCLISSRFFSIRFVSVHVVHKYSRIDTTIG